MVPDSRWTYDNGIKYRDYKNNWKEKKKGAITKETRNIKANQNCTHCPADSNQ